MTGLVSYRSGLAAEQAVARYYTDAGQAVAATRWRGSGGEIDLVMRGAESIIFVEVKKASTHARAAERLGARQQARIFASASEFLAGEPRGQDTDCRFDVALVDASGQIEVLENAFAA